MEDDKDIDILIDSELEERTTYEEPPLDDINTSLLAQEQNNIKLLTNIHMVLFLLVMFSCLVPGYFIIRYNQNDMVEFIVPSIYMLFCIAVIITSMILKKIYNQINQVIGLKKKRFNELCCIISIPTVIITIILLSFISILKNKSAYVLDVITVMTSYTLTLTYLITT